MIFSEIGRTAAQTLIEETAKCYFSGEQPGVLSMHLKLRAVTSVTLCLRTKWKHTLVEEGL